MHELGGVALARGFFFRQKKEEPPCPRLGRLRPMPPSAEPEPNIIAWAVGCKASASLYQRLRAQRKNCLPGWLALRPSFQVLPDGPSPDQKDV
jgi:hypothetical protein